MIEEMNLIATEREYLYTTYYAKSNTLMLNYRTVVTSKDLSGKNNREVDDARWFTYNDATKAVIPNSLAEKLLKSLKNWFQED